MLRPTLSLPFVFFAAAGLAATGAAPLPPFGQLRELVQTNALDISAEQLDRTASEAILGLVHGRILEAGEVVNEESAAPAIAEKRGFEPGCLYVRAGQVSLGFGPQLAAVLTDPALSTNSLGLILDLRFATGTEYAGAAGAADLFATDAGPLLDWGTGRADATPKTNAWSRPVVVLVNRETRGAAEALAGVLRVQRTALVVGNRTSGTAAIYRDLPLADGRRLRMAASGVKTGDGQPVPSSGLVPDIQIAVSPELERSYLGNPYGSQGSATNSIPSSAANATVAARHRITEADLVRARKAGEPDPDPDALATLRAPASTMPLVHDPVLSRAIDLLKGLGIIRSAKP